MSDVDAPKEAENLTIEENCNCKGCDVEMTQQEVFFKDGLVKMSRENKTEADVENWCKKCVDASPMLIHKSNEMIRHFVYLLVRDTDKETRQIMKEEIKVLRPDDYELVKDLFEIESFYEITEVKEQVVVEAEAEVPNPIVEEEK